MPAVVLASVDGACVAKNYAVVLLMMISRCLWACRDDLIALVLLDWVLVVNDVDDDGHHYYYYY